MNEPKSEKLIIKEEATVAEYVNAAAAASNRARNVIIVLVVSTVLLAIEIRNSSFSWLDARTSVRSEALKLLEHHYDYLTAAVDPDNETPKNPAKLFLKDHNLRPDDQIGIALLTKENDDYRRSAVEQVSLLHLPFFGVVIDHNDIGMFGGFTFAVVLLWLRYSLASELGNLKLLFDTDKSVFKIDPKRCYDLLAMQQVLTVPHLPCSPNRHRWRWIPKLLYGIPAVVYTGQIFFDFARAPHGMWRVGEVLGTGKMWLLVISSSILFVIVAAFTASCIKILRDIDKVWDKAVLSVYPELVKQRQRRRRQPRAAARVPAAATRLGESAGVK